MKLRRQPFNTVEQLEHFLCERYRLGVITATEHTRLNNEGLGAEMSSNDHSEYARYSRVNIERSARALPSYLQITEAVRPMQRNARD